MPDNTEQISKGGRPVIVTGGAGFVGSNLIAGLLKRKPNRKVIAVDNFRSGSFANIVEACEREGVGAFTGEVITADAGNLDWESIVEQATPGAIYHLAAITDTTVMDEAEMIRVNAEEFRELLHVCADSRVPLVYASSAATYGTPPQARDRVPFPEPAAGKPNNVYGFSKWLMENMHRDLIAEYTKHEGRAPNIVGLRYFNVFGPGESRKGKMASMAYQLAMQMLAGKRPRLFADGSQARDQVSVSDVVDCTINAARDGVTPGVYNLGSGQTTSFADIAAAVRAGVGLAESELPTDYFEMPADIRAFYQDYTCADMSATKKAIGWEPKHDPRTAIRQYAAYLKQHHAHA